MAETTPIFAQLPESTCDESFHQRLRNRDTQAFDHLVSEQSPRIHELVSRLLGWSHDCDDVVQDVFVIAWERIDKFRGDAKVSTWLYSIAINQCRKQRRDFGILKRGFQKFCEVWVSENQGDNRNLDFRISASRVPDIEQIHAAINRLAHGDRELIALCLLEGKTMDEAGTLLNVRKNTLEVRLHRARKRLKQILESSADE